MRRHGRIIFSGNGYSSDWVEEAANRGLSNYPSSAEAIPHALDKKNVELLERHGVLSRTEVAAVVEILLENYCKTIHIEAATMAELWGLYVPEKSEALTVGNYFHTALESDEAHEAFCNENEELIFKLTVDKKTGEYINEPVDTFNHTIDAIRYGLNKYIKGTKTPTVVKKPVGL